MIRAITIAALLAALLASAAGCTSDTGGAASQTAATGTAQPADATPPEGFDAIPTDGPGESAALAALPAALEEGERIRTSGVAWPDLTGAEPRLVAYLVRADYDGQVGLFEVRADGIAHNIYAFQQAFDSGSIVWTPAEMAQSPTAAPQGEREKAAVAAVTAAMADAFPGESITYAVHGYRFAYLAGSSVVLFIEIDPTGKVISVGN
jgi:hypothetical protein